MAHLRVQDREKHREYDRKWYHANKETRRAACDRRREELKAWFAAYKATLSCGCGEHHPACIDFHHRDPKTKVAHVTDMVRFGWSKTKIEAEIAKCDVMCANCHRKHHWDEKHLGVA